MSKTINKTKRVSTAFHETFALNLPSISGLLGLAVEKNGKVTAEDMKDNIQLGNNYIKVMPRYAKACGLLDLSGYSVTKLGQAVFDNDPDILNLTTLWLMHYHLCAPHGPGPLFWNFAFTHLFKIGGKIDSEKLGKDIANHIVNVTGERLHEKTTKDSARILLKSYSKSDALGSLNIISETDGMYLIQEPDPPSAWVIGYALADYWEAHFGDRQGINLSEINSADNFLSIFFMGSGAFLSKLSELQKEGLLQVQRVAPPHQLNKLWTNKADFLERIYV